MNKVDFEPFLTTQLSKLFSFAFSLIPEELQAEQLVIDAYSVFAVREKDTIEDFDLDLEDVKDRAIIKRFITLHMLAEIYELGVKKSAHFKNSLVPPVGKEAFYSLDVSQRAVLFLSDSLDFSVDEIAETLNWKKFQVLERLYNSRNLVLKKTNVGATINE